MTNACIVGIRTQLITLLLNARIRRPLQKKLYNGLTKLIVVRSPLPLRNSYSVLFLSPKETKGKDLGVPVNENCVTFAT